MENYLINFIMIFLMNIFGFFYAREIRLVLFFDVIFLATTCMFLIFAHDEFRVLMIETYLLKQIIVFFWIFHKNFSSKSVKYNLGINVFAIMNLTILTLQIFYFFDNFVTTIAILMISSLLFKFVTSGKLNLNTIFSIGFISIIILISTNPSYSLYSLDDAILRNFTYFRIIFLFLVFYVLFVLFVLYKTFKPGLTQFAHDIGDTIKFLLAYILMLSFLQVFVPYNQDLITQNVVASLLLSFMQVRGVVILRHYLLKKYSLWL